MSPSKNYLASVTYSPVSPLSPASSAPSTPCKFVHVDPATFEALSRDSRGSTQHLSGCRSGPLPRNVEYVEEVQRQAMSGPLYPHQTKQKRYSFSGVLRDYSNKNALNSKPLSRAGSPPLPLPPVPASVTSNNVEIAPIHTEKKAPKEALNDSKTCLPNSSSNNRVHLSLPLPQHASCSDSVISSERRTRSLESCVPHSDSRLHKLTPDAPSNFKQVAYKLPPPPLSPSIKPSNAFASENNFSQKSRNIHHSSRLLRKPKMEVAN